MQCVHVQHVPVFACVHLGLFFFVQKCVRAGVCMSVFVWVCPGVFLREHLPTGRAPAASYHRRVTLCSPKIDQASSHPRWATQPTAHTHTHMGACVLSRPLNMLLHSISKSCHCLMESSLQSFKGSLWLVGAHVETHSRRRSLDDRPQNFTFICWREDIVPLGCTHWNFMTN